MRRLLLTGVGLVLVLYLLPVFYPSETDKTEPQAPTESVTAAATDGVTITVLVNGKAQEMPLETYVEGVTAAEIADDFPVEAIRAQAVAVRPVGKVGGQDAAHGAVGVIQFLCQRRQPVSPAGGEDETAAHGRVTAGKLPANAGACAGDPDSFCHMLTPCRSQKRGRWPPALRR